MPRTRMAQSPLTAEWMISRQHEEEQKSNQPQQQQQQQLELEPAEAHVFLGEESRACFRHLHIVKMRANSYIIFA
jgi:hypothetical protein